MLAHLRLVFWEGQEKHKGLQPQYLKLAFLKGRKSITKKPGAMLQTSEQDGTS